MTGYTYPIPFMILKTIAEDEYCKLSTSAPYKQIYIVFVSHRFGDKGKVRKTYIVEYIVHTPRARRNPVTKSMNTGSLSALQSTTGPAVRGGTLECYHQPFSSHI
jgi:hypothetical protein